jgi:hypothetical protein
MEPRPEPARPPGWLPKAEFDSIFSRKRVARDELGLEVAVGDLLGYIEYPSHYDNGLDSPVGLAFMTEVVAGFADANDLREGCAWFSRLPDGLYAEQRDFLTRHVGLGP